jgi:hypothetical protein
MFRGWDAPVPNLERVSCRSCRAMNLARWRLFCHRAEWQHNFAGEFIENLRESGVDRGESTEDSFITGEMFESGARRGEIAVSKQEEQDRERAENNLQGAVQPQRAEKHDRGKESPHGEICGHRRVVGLRTPADFREDDQCHERQPEQAVRNERGCCESVAFPPFHDAGDDLRRAAITNTHRQNHAVEFVEAGVVQIK